MSKDSLIYDKKILLGIGAGLIIATYFMFSAPPHEEESTAKQAEPIQFRGSSHPSDYLIDNQIIEHHFFKAKNGLPETVTITVASIIETVPGQHRGYGTFKSDKTTYYFIFDSSIRGLSGFKVIEHDKCVPHPEYPKMLPCYNVNDEPEKGLPECYPCHQDTPGIRCC